MCLLRRVPLLLASLVAPSTTAKIIPVKSTVDAPFFDPTNTTAEVGDIVEFHFAAHNRSVVMGSFDHPCQPVATGGFFSGFFTENDTATENPTVFRVTVNDTNPILYYCSQNTIEFGNHCKQGMAGVINEPDLSKLQTYRDAAALINTSVTPSSQSFGGVLVANPDSDAVHGTDSKSGSTSGADGRVAATIWECLAAVFVAILVGY